MSQRIKAMAWVGIFALALITVVFAVGRTLDVVEMGLLGDPDTPDPFAIRYNYNPILTLLHILPGSLFFLIGPFQFLRRLRSSHINLHRWMGRVYIVLGSTAAITAILLAHRLPAFGGVGTATATYLFGTLFLVCVFMAVRRILQGDTVHHRQWMIRGFAIALGVSTIRLAVAFFEITTDLEFVEFFPTAFWLGFVINLLVAETWINLTRGTPESAW